LPAYLPRAPGAAQSWLENQLANLEVRPTEPPAGLWLRLCRAVDQWNFFVERGFGRAWLLAVGYVGSHGSDLPWRGYPLGGNWDIPDSTLQSWRAGWYSSSGLSDPATVRIANPLPALVGQAAGTIGSATIPTIDAQKPYLALLGQTILANKGIRERFVSANSCLRTTATTRLRSRLGQRRQCGKRAATVREWSWACSSPPLPVAARKQIPNTRASPESVPEYHAAAVRFPDSPG